MRHGHRIIMNIEGADVAVLATIITTRCSSVHKDISQKNYASTSFRGYVHALIQK